MALPDLLNQLEKVRKTGKDRYVACCPSHADRNPSLTITEKPDGMVLIKCWAGCGAAEILDAVGLDYAALYPERPEGHAGKPVRKPWNPYDLLKIMAFEATVARLCAARTERGESITEAERQRWQTAIARLNAAAEAANG